MILKITRCILDILLQFDKVKMQDVGKIFIVIEILDEYS